MATPGVPTPGFGSFRYRVWLHLVCLHLVSDRSGVGCADRFSSTKVTRCANMKASGSEKSVSMFANLLPKSLHHPLLSITFPYIGRYLGVHIPLPRQLSLRRTPKRLRCEYGLQRANSTAQIRFFVRDPAKARLCRHPGARRVCRCSRT